MIDSGLLQAPVPTWRAPAPPAGRVSVPGATGMARPWLDQLIDGAWRVSLTTVTAPTGWGKTTLLADFARRHRRRSRAVAWYGADGPGPAATRLFPHLRRAVAHAVPGVDPGWDSVDLAVSALGRGPIPPLALVVDDAQALDDSSAGDALVELAARLPPDAHLIVSARSRPTTDLLGHAHAGRVLEVDRDDLRFRLPEVEELFSSWYGVARGADELAALTRRTGGRPAGLALFHLTTAHENEARRAELLRSDDAVAAHPAGGSSRPALVAPARLRVVPAPDTLSVHCLGPFQLVAGVRPVDVRAVKPRFRSVLQYLAVHAGRPAHRDELCTTFWPGEDARSGHRSLQVAISAIRQHLEAEAGAGGAMVRRGESYLLEHRGGFHDLTALEQAVRAARGDRTRAGGGTGSGEAAVVAGLRAATELYRGDLLAEIGTPEWVLEPRDRYRLLAAEAHVLLAERLLADDQAEEAAGVAERGLAVDRYCDGLWRLMIEAHDRGANQAAGAQARRSYRQVLAELGVGS